MLLSHLQQELPKEHPWAPAEKRPNEADAVVGGPGGEGQQELEEGAE